MGKYVTVEILTYSMPLICRCNNISNYFEFKANEWKLRYELFKFNYSAEIENISCTPFSYNKHNNKKPLIYATV